MMVVDEEADPGSLSSKALRYAGGFVSGFSCLCLVCLKLVGLAAFN